MNAVLKIVASLSVLTLIMSCTSKSPYEKKGDAAYKFAQTLQGDKKRLQLKTAYMMYDQAMKANPGNITPTLRNRYIEMTLIRANMVLNEGAAHMDAIPLFMEDVKKNLTPEVTPDLKQQFALFMLQLADSSFVKEKYDDAIKIVEDAKAYASDVAPINTKKAQIIGKVSEENLAIGEIEFANGKSEKNEESFVKAEFYALTALYFDSNNVAAKKLLTNSRKENLATYSAFLKVIDPIPDSAVFKKINKYDVLLAMPTMQKRGGMVSTIISIYNYSWGPLRLKSENFYLVDGKGKKYVAKSARLTPELLDQEHEAKLKLSFPAPAGEIVSLVYEEGKDHRSEKFLK
jgi:hypothetical protein